MIGANQYNLTWEHFAELHEDKSLAFENLCRALFMRNFCDDKTILHSNPNHPGVEVEPICTCDNDKYISFQAKYFTSKVGYTQIKDSANKVITYYKDHLDKLYIYCNLDISTITDKYQEIEKLLSDANIEIILVTGQTILDQASEYPTILATYFGLDYIDKEWFDKKLDLALADLGNRYNAKFNIDTRAQKQLALFLREDIAIADINERKSNLVQKLNNIRWECEEDDQKRIDFLVENINNLPDVVESSLTAAIDWKQDLCFSSSNELNDLKLKSENLGKKLDKLSYNAPEYNKTRGELFTVNQILETINNLELTDVEKGCIKGKVAIVTGGMGAGKTQLLATAAKRISQMGGIALLFLGQTMITSDPIEQQLINTFPELNANQSLVSLLNVIEEYSENSHKESFIFIDAINESRERDIWKIGISRFINILRNFPHIRLVLSLRNGFEKLTLSDYVIQNMNSNTNSFVTICHNGFSDNSPNAIYEFLSKCGIPFSPEYYLQFEMTNPLFLMWFSQTYSGEEQGLYELIEKVISKGDEEASKEAGSIEPYGILQDLLCSVIEYNAIQSNALLNKKTLYEFPIWNTYGIANKIAYIKSIERFGLLASYTKEDQEIFYIGYNLLEDYLVAKSIINMFSDKQEIKKYLSQNLLGIDKNGEVTHIRNHSVFVMAATLFAIKYGEECIDIIDKINSQWDKHDIAEKYFESFTWRSSHICLETVIDLANQYQIYPKKIWDVFIENATKKDSNLNAYGLSKVLDSYDLNRRDYLWTISINSLSEDDRIVSLAYYIEQGNPLDSLTEENVKLLLILYTWMLSSSNRTLRDRISKAMIEILRVNFKLCLPILKQFRNINDPYILQRLFGVVFGAVIKRQEPLQACYKELVEWIVETIFAQDRVYPDILLRDYARLIVERYFYEVGNQNIIKNIEKIRPPYCSEPIPKAKILDYDGDKYKIPGVSQILFSMKFDFPVKGIGMYGDFGRYTFQSALSEFADVDLENIYYYSLDYILNTLGYSSELFGEYDSCVHARDRHDTKKTERIGKKYQWIAMYNILARVSDTHTVKEWIGCEKNSETYKGPWNPHVRDFDPTLNTRYGKCKSIPNVHLPMHTSEEFIHPNASETEIQEWVQKESTLFSAYPERFLLKDDLGTEWISLYHYNEHKVQPDNNSNHTFGFAKGEQRIWTLTTSYCVPQMNPEELLNKLRNHGFSESNYGVMDCYSLFSREYAWSSGYEDEFKNIDYCEEDSSDNLKDVFVTAINVLWEKQFDASQEEATSFMIPSGKIISALSLEERKFDGLYYDNSELVAFDLFMAGYAQHELIIKKDYLIKFLKDNAYSLFWIVSGEKQFFKGDGFNQIWQPIKGYFVLTDSDTVGELTTTPKA